MALPRVLEIFPELLRRFLGIKDNLALKTLFIHAPSGPDLEVYIMLTGAAQFYGYLDDILTLKGIL